MIPEIIMLGTGNAMPATCYNSCFVIRSEYFTLLADGGGGNRLFQQLNSAKIKCDEITHIYLSHAHTDHIFGIVWFLRERVQALINGTLNKHVILYANRQTVEALLSICRLTYLRSYFDLLTQAVEIIAVDPPCTVNLSGADLKFFDVGSENVEQLGFKLTFESGISLIVLGDEALTDANASYAVGAEYLICGAFCRYADRDIFHPYEKHHLTVQDVARTAEKIHIKNLILYHSEDRTPNKANSYVAEAMESFTGKVIIPSDLDKILLT